MKHVIVTGGAGFIGSHLCDNLLKKGYAVTAIDNLITGVEENLREASGNPNFEFIRADICEVIPESRISLLKKHGLHGILHFACPASPVDFEKIPFEILAVDSVGTLHMVDLAYRHHARFLLASTSEVYGDPLVHPQKEEYWGNVNTIGPRSCYDETKRFAEAVVSTGIRGTSKKGKLNAGIVRIFNTYGPRMRADDGRVVPEFCVQALQGKPLTLHGDGAQTRSFCFISDLIDGILKVFESDISVPVNLGNPVEKTIREFAETVMKLAGVNTGYEHLPAREDDPRRRCPDITRAKDSLGWSPKVQLEEGLRQTVEYFRGQTNQKPAPQASA